MAPKKADNTKGSNRIRLIVLDADLSDGNLSELTQAITNAIKPAVAPLRQLPHPAGQVVRTQEEATPEEPESRDFQDEADEGEAANDNGATPKPTRTKKFKAPEYLPDLLAGDKGAAFKKFAQEKAPDSKTQKYLVATYRLKEQGGSPTVNANKIYTCFKTAGWSTGFNDWNQTFHNLVYSEHLRKLETTGEFAINPLGEDAVTTGED